MSVLVDIVRTEDRRTVPITVSELRTLATSRSDLRVEDAMGNPHVDAFVFWISRSTTEPALYLKNGVLTTKGVDEPLFEWMFLLAASLNARVRDDEYLTYVSLDEPYVHPDDDELRREAAVVGENLVRDTRRRKIIAYFVMASLLLFFIVMSMLRGLPLRTPKS